jgi:predicted transcriptional regulator
MSALTVELPDDLHAKVREAAVAKNLSMDTMIAIALEQSLSRTIPDAYLEERAARATGRGLSEFLAKVPSAEPPEWDRLPEGYDPRTSPAPASPND